MVTTDGKGRMIIVTELDDGRVRLETPRIKEPKNTDELVDIFKTESIELYPDELLQEGLTLMSITLGVDVDDIGDLIYSAMEDGERSDRSCDLGFLRRNEKQVSRMKAMRKLGMDWDDISKIECAPSATLSARLKDFEEIKTRLTGAVE